MTATATENLTLHKIEERHTVARRDGRGGGEPYTVITGVPGGVPGEEGIVLWKPVPGFDEGEPYEEKVSGGTYMHSWRKILYFHGSPRFPDGVWIGEVCDLVDTGIGQPFVESSHKQMGEDAFLRLESYAYGKPYMSMTQRRDHAKRTEQHMAERGSGLQRPETVTPAQSLREVADATMDARIAAAVSAALAAEREKAEAAAKSKGKKAE